MDYLTPSIIAIAAKKTFSHRTIMATPDRDRSLQYGSEINAVSRILEEETQETVVESVVDSIEPPL
jgi:hypothetical protein